MFVSRLGRVCVLAIVWMGGAQANLRAEPLSAGKVAVPASEEKKYPEVDEAVAKFSAGKPEEARTLLEAAAKRYPDLSPAGIMLARLYFAANQEMPGRMELERVVLAQPNDPEAYELLGNLALAARRITEADLLYQKVAALVDKLPDSPRKSSLMVRLHAGLATVAESRAQWNEAKAHLDQWVKLADKDPRAHVRLAQTLFQLEQPDQAYQEFAAATKLSDETPVPEIMMARLYEQSGKSEKATEWMKLVVQRHPNNASAHVGVAEWYWRNNKLEEAQKHAAKALEIKPDLLDAKLIRGIVARFQKDYPEAEKQFEAAHLAAPANFLAANQLALVLAEQQDTEKLNRALQLAQLNAKQHQQEPEVLATLGTVLYKGGRVDDAERFLRQLASMNVMSGDAAYYLGQILAKKNQTDEAKRLLRVALSSQGPFVNRDAAQSLLDQLSKPPGG